jgi:hypothetical protein
METEYTLLERLGRPFAVSQLKWRKGGGNLNLVYITSRDVMRRLDEVCGTDWQCRYSHVTDSGLTCCEIGIKINDEWIFRASGAGETTIEGSKGTFTDAFKRAGVAWGIGRYLYYGDIQPDSIPEWATQEGYDLIIKQRKEQEND